MDPGLTFEAFYRNSLDGVLLTRPDGAVLAANPAACELLRMSEAQICARGRGGLADPDDPRWADAVAERAHSGRFRGDLRLLRGDGSSVEVEVTSQVFEDGDGTLNTCVVLRDATARVLLQAHLREANAALAGLALRDPLTGLYNRRGLTVVASQQLADVARAPERVWVAFADVDGMKSINDTHGHEAGDAALNAVARLLTEESRDGDIVARVGGDEFCVLLAAGSRATAGRFADRIRERTGGLRLEGGSVQMSIGMAQEPLRSIEDLADRMAEADRAMYAEKAAARRMLLRLVT